ncbi:DUF1674-domain-containing protein [Westerdykella ornata]|uniref:Succinate dehydrogenase assembly factor 4, mitochondrial n=1 Tax=Westerdykella ornata TaxID=318751 RepID=A0A6A6JAL4_WESOR|nr:DUF1674-domain-containing protein [Westerdykella ornata]KAF2273307.1 DUF1674-domain-containing protein [Westerdykella ornata]
MQTIRLARHLRPLQRLRVHPQRTISTNPRHFSPSSPFGSGPAPPRLPKEEQEIFERLQRQSTGAFSTPRPEINQSPDSSSLPSSSSVRINQSPDLASGDEIRTVDAVRIQEGEEVHPNLRRGAPPEFEGDVNPKTGEIGGPKNEPLRWGAQGDWSYNGRVTDF